MVTSPLPPGGLLSLWDVVSRLQGEQLIAGHAPNIKYPTWRPHWIAVHLYNKARLEYSLLSIIVFGMLLLALGCSRCRWRQSGGSPDREDGGRSMPAEPMINFAVHQARAGAGASEDFEQMLALLVQAVEGEANLVFANPGDWGIDVLVGDLQGRVSIWQAKYFARGVAESQKKQINDSFNSAMRAASAHGYMVACWVLCVPSSMDGPTRQWWRNWQAKHERDGPRIELWDETELRRLLLKPAATHIRQHYYNPYRHGGVDDEPKARRYPTAPEPASAWQGGDEVRLGGVVYLLHDEPTEQHSADRSWIWREATADRIEPGAGRVRLRQVHVLRQVPAAEQRRGALRAQATLLSQVDGRHGLPRLLDVGEQPQGTTLVTTHPPGRPWVEVFGPGPVPPDRLTVAGLLASAANVCAGLRMLHERWHSHRALSPEVIVVDRGQRGFVRDVGLAAIPPGPAEGAARYRAPEQIRAPYVTDGRIDIYQVAAVVYHTVTGHLPAGAATRRYERRCRIFPRRSTTPSGVRWTMTPAVPGR
jgi:hypothetical protein